MDTDKAYPTKEGPAATDKAVVPIEEAGSLSKGAKATVLLLHAGHLTHTAEALQ